MFTSLTGYRTYLCTAGAAILLLAAWLGFINMETALMLIGFLGFGSKSLFASLSLCFLACSFNLFNASSVA